MKIIHNFFLNFSFFQFVDNALLQLLPLPFRCYSGMFFGDFLKKTEMPIFRPLDGGSVYRHYHMSGMGGISVSDCSILLQMRLFCGSNDGGISGERWGLFIQDRMETCFIGRVLNCADLEAGVNVGVGACCDIFFLVQLCKSIVFFLSYLERLQSHR